MNRDHAENADAASSAEHSLVAAAFAQFERLSGRLTAPTSPGPEPPLIPGYRLLREIHRGGQGVVYQAIHLSTQRKMAIKVLRQGPFADRVELARFEREIDILSRLDHPHIVAIHDRGLVAGHAYYVMDYIPGRPLDAFVAGAALPLDDLIRLFIKVCDAVNVAHLRGVIHRDLKPSNILVVDVDSDEDTPPSPERALPLPASVPSCLRASSAQPKILDFGLAKVAQEAASASSAGAMTLTGQFVGSLPWTSPEQATGRADLIDLRSDVYSLGVLLYQLLTGRFPYPVTGRLDDVARHVEFTTPVPLRAVRRDIDHDLELITLSCLAKEPQRRYQSAGDLARDLRRYLAREPVSATSPSAAYRLRKFVRRNRGPVIAAAVIALTLLCAAAVSLAFAVREARQRAAAESALRRAEQAEAQAETRAGELEQVAAFQEKQLAGIDARAMGTRFRDSLLEKVRAAGARAQLTPQDMDERIAQLESLIAGSDFTGLALSALEDNFFQPALSAIDEQFADQPLVKARLLQTLASTLQQVGLLEAATAPQEEALAIRRRLLGNEHPDTLHSVSEMGLLIRRQGRLAEAEPFYHAALDGRRRALGDDHPETLRSLSNLCLLLHAQGRLDEADQYARQALEMRRRRLGDEHPDTLTSLSTYGFLLQERGQLDLAERYYREVLEKRRRVLGEDHPHTLFSINNVATLLHTQGRLDEARELYDEALEKRRRVLGNDHPDTLQSINNLGSLLNAQGKLDEAEPYHREALETRRRVLGENHPHTLSSIGNLGTLLLNMERPEEAETYTREAMEKRRLLLGEDHPDTLFSMSQLARVLERRGRLHDAEVLAREAVQRARSALGPDHVYAYFLNSNLAALLQTMGRHDEAVDVLIALEPTARSRRTGLAAPRLAHFLLTLARARTATGEFELAEDNLLEAYDILAAAEGATETDRASCLNALTDLYTAWPPASPDTPDHQRP